MSIGEAHWRCYMYCEAAVMGKIRDLFILGCALENKDTMKFSNIKIPYLASML